MKIKKISLILGSIVATTSIATTLVSACANSKAENNLDFNNQKYEEIRFISAINSNTTGEETYITNFLTSNFLNKLNNNNNNEVDNIINDIKVKSKEDFVIPIPVIYKKMRGEMFEINSLPQNIELLNIKNESKWFNVVWELTQDFKITRNTTIKGVANNGLIDVEVKAYIVVQTKNTKLQSDYLNRDDGMIIDLEKTTKDGGGKENIAKLIDRNGDYVNSPSRWDNWNAYNREQDNNIVFKWDNPVEISRLGINFWRYASRGGSEGKYPKNVYIQYSQDGENWVNVSNQDKVAAVDFGPMNAYSGRINNVSDTKTINFKSVNTKWIRFHWEPATDDQNRNLIIGITNMQFFGKDNYDDPIILNKNNKILKINYDNQLLILNNIENDYIFDVNSFSENIEYLTHASIVEQFLVQKNETKRVYKIIAYNDLNQKTIYQITFNKRSEGKDEN